MNKFLTSEETLGYYTNVEETNTDKRFLVTGSQNVLIDSNKKVRIRPGYTRLGAGNDAGTPVRNAWTWHTSTGTELMMRIYDDELEVYLGTVDATVINAWKRVKDSWSTTEIMRPALWFDTQENIDLLLMVIGDANIYEWSGAVAVVSSITGTTITKAGTETFAQARFYSAGSLSVTCVRTGTAYTYTGGFTTLTLTGVPDTTGLIVGDILVQTVVTNSNEPTSSHTNHNIFSFENQIVIGSEDDEEVHISKSTDFTDYAYSAPRIAGEGGLLTLDGTSKGFASLGSFLLAFCGRSSIYRANYVQITVGTTLSETLRVKKLDTGIDQGAINQEVIIPVADSLIYLSHEPALRQISNPEDIGGLKPITLSNPIKPDFDAEDFTNAFGKWYKNSILISAPVNSKIYMLEYVEDANGSLRRYWNPPQILPVRAFTIYNELLYGHSNGVPETYELFTGVSDYVPNGTIGDPDSKLPVNAIAAFSYNLYGDRVNLKTFDEHFTEGEITANTTDLLLTINYDFGGSTQVLERTIDGSDEDILEGNVGFNSLGQQNLGVNPLGGLLNPPDDARKFRIIHDSPRDDFRMIQDIYSTNDVDRFWSIISYGNNAKISPRRDTTIHK